MQNSTFLVLLRPIFGEKINSPPLKEIGCRSWEVDVVTRPEKAFEFSILAEKFVSISMKTFFLETTCFWAKKAFEFPSFPRNSVKNNDNSGQGCLQFSHSFKKALPPFSNPGYAPETTPLIIFLGQACKQDSFKVGEGRA